ncbi:DegV family protein [Clostridium sp. Cult1]|uniref:DegV family protein n=1 Tax=Clostridium sp. Cult1 TaxID=2079002 RepID=UPI001F29325E|nr:DegV family protein [Clostridium sp. Cult1]MCF6463652.1 DegV family protein [Clostridium sp. Cult1]
MSVKILSDSACDLPREIIDEYNIDILPIIVIKDDTEYLDGVTIDPKDLYDNMRAGQVYKTAQIPPKMFEEKFEEYAKNGEDVIYIAFSSGLSSTYQTSVLTRDSLKDKYPNMNIDIVDSKSASVGFGLLVHKAAQMAKEGKSKEEILKMLDFYIRHIEHIFTVDNIEYLFRGGRVTRTQAFVGGLLNIKPILDIPEDGTLQPREKVRGRKKVLTRMIEIMEERADHADLKKQVIGINHGDDIEGAMKLKGMIEEKFGCTNFIINVIGCAIGAHSGPGTLSVFFLNEKYKE